MEATKRGSVPPVPKYIKSLVPYPPGKPLEELEREYGITGSIKLASNENPLGPSPKALRAMEKAVRGLHRYPDGSSYYLKNRLAEIYKVGQDQIVLGNGSNEVIDFLIRVFVDQESEVISSDPSFLVYRKMVQATGGNNVLVPLKDDRHDLDAILRAVTPRTRIIFLDNPNNPMGTVIRKKDFDRLLNALPENVLVVLDEAYMEFVTDTDTPKGHEYLDSDRRVVFLRTFSKAYGLAGLRIGYGVMDPEVATNLEKVRQPFNINTMAQVAALAALDDREHLEASCKVTWEGIDQLTKGLTKLGCRPLPTQTNYVMVDVGKDAKKVYEAMLRKGVIVRSMASYGFTTFIRITAGTQQENKRCLNALEQVLDETG